LAALSLILSFTKKRGGLASEQKLMLEIAAMQHHAFDKALLGEVERIDAQAKIAELVKSLDDSNNI
jgi:hypothetical protein